MELCPLELAVGWISGLNRRCLFQNDFNWWLDLVLLDLLQNAEELVAQVVLLILSLRIKVVLLLDHWLKLLLLGSVLVSPSVEPLLSQLLLCLLPLLLLELEFLSLLLVLELPELEVSLVFS